MLWQSGLVPRSNAQGGKGPEEKSRDRPSTMPRPDRRIGTRQILWGWTSVVWYSKPIGVTSCSSAVSDYHGIRRQPRDAGEEGRGTFPPEQGSRAVASASQPTISDISCTRDLTSLGRTLLDRSWPSFASRQGCFDT